MGFFARGPRSGEAWLRSHDSDGWRFRRRRLRGERTPASGGQSAAADQGVVHLLRVGCGSKNAKDIHDIFEKLLDDKKPSTTNELVLSEELDPGSILKFSTNEFEPLLPKFLVSSDDPSFPNAAVITHRY